MLDLRVDSGKARQCRAHPKMLFGLEQAWVIKCAQSEIDEAVIIALAPGNA